MTLFILGCLFGAIPLVIAHDRTMRVLERMQREHIATFLDAQSQARRAEIAEKKLRTMVTFGRN